LRGSCKLAVMRKVGVGLVVASYALLIYTSLAAPAYARAHQYLGPAVLAAYAAPWPVALACTVAVAGIMLALVPLRRGERWALWTLLAMLTISFLTRITTDPRCLVVLDPHQHGCHTFMIAVLLGVVGLALCWR
jgi:nicotinamide riboside transporter PnuC